MSGEIWCIDLDGCISSTPDAMRALMGGLQAQGCEVHVLSGSPGIATQEELADKKALLDSLGVGDCFDKLIAVSGPEKDVAAGKVNYLTHVGAKALVDDRKKNCKAARKAGVLALRHLGPK